jgi:hypothetical protein
MVVVISTNEQLKSTRTYKKSLISMDVGMMFKHRVDATRVTNTPLAKIKESEDRVPSKTVWLRKGMPLGKKEESSIVDKIIYVPSLTKPILAIVNEASPGMKLEFCIKYSYRSFLHVRATGRIAQIPMSEAYLVSISNSN